MGFSVGPVGSHSNTVFILNAATGRASRTSVQQFFTYIIFRDLQKKKVFRKHFIFRWSAQFLYCTSTANYLRRCFCQENVALWV